MLQARDGTPDEVSKTGLIHRVHLPERSGRAKPPLVILVHGRAGNASVMWFFAKAFSSEKSVGPRPVIVSPQAPEADPDGGFSWWKFAHPGGRPESRSREERFLDAAATATLVSTFIQACIELYDADPAMLVAAGFSQGSAVVSSLSVMRPELFQGVAILSGFIPKGVMDSPEELPPAGNTKYFIAHGMKDEIIPVVRADETAAWLKERGSVVEYLKEDVTHKVGSQSLKALGRWYEDFFPANGKA